MTPYNNAQTCKNMTLQCRPSMLEYRNAMSLTVTVWNCFIHKLQVHEVHGAAKNSTDILLSAMWLKYQMQTMDKTAKQFRYSVHVRNT